MTQATTNTFSFTLNPLGEYSGVYPRMSAAKLAADSINRVDLNKYDWACAMPVKIPGNSGSWGIDIIDLETLETIGSV